MDYQKIKSIRARADFKKNVKVSLGFINSYSDTIYSKPVKDVKFDLMMLANSSLEMQNRYIKMLSKDIVQSSCHKSCIVNHDKISSLPNVLLCKIFSFLSMKAMVKRVFLVSRHWQDLFYCRDSWNTIIYKLRLLPLIDFVKTSVKDLSLIRSVNWQIEGIFDVEFPRLEILDVYNMKYFYFSVKQDLNLSNLRELNLFFDNDDDDDDETPLNLPFLPSLKILHIINANLGEIIFPNEILEVRLDDCSFENISKKTIESFIICHCSLTFLQTSWKFMQMMDYFDFKFINMKNLVLDGYWEVEEDVYNKICYNVLNSVSDFHFLNMEFVSTGIIYKFFEKNLPVSLLNVNLYGPDELIIRAFNDTLTSMYLYYQEGNESLKIMGCFSRLKKLYIDYPKVEFINFTAPNISEFGINRITDQYIQFIKNSKTISEITCEESSLNFDLLNQFTHLTFYFPNVTLDIDTLPDHIEKLPRIFVEEIDGKCPERFSIFEISSLPIYN